ncbi:MAG: homoserine kinase, partial [Candidatus Krumholzibacteriia bacterium]
VLAGHLLADDGSPDPEQIAHEAAEIEGHPDNVAPSVYGGLVATTCVGAHLHTVQLPFPALDIVLVIPQHAVSTREARRILPEQVPLTAAVFNLSRLAALLGALSTQDLDALRLGMQDRLHQEHRLALVPGLDTALQALLEEPDSLGAAISGSGPTLLALYRSAPDDAGRAAVAALEEAGVTARIQRIRPSTRGASWERVQSP